MDPVANLSVEPGVWTRKQSSCFDYNNAPDRLRRSTSVWRPWLHTDEIEKLNDKESKWIGLTTSSAPVICVTVTYRI